MHPGVLYNNVHLHAVHVRILYNSKLLFSTGSTVYTFKAGCLREIESNGEMGIRSIDAKNYNTNRALL